MMEFQTILKLCCILAVLSIDSIQTANVLVLSPPMWSQVNQFIQLALPLQEKYGHRVTFLMEQNSIERLQKQLPETFGTISSSVRENFDPKTLTQDDVCKANLSLMKYLKFFVSLPSNFTEYCNNFLSEETLIKKVKEGKFDVALINSAMVFRGCYSVLAYKLGIPIIMAGSLYDPVNMGIPFHPSSTPYQPMLHVGNHMTFMERIKNFMLFSFSHFWDNFFYSDNLVAKYAKEKPYVGVTDIIRNASMWLVDVDPLMDVVRPTLPHVKLVGGLSSSSAKELPAEYKNFMDTAYDGAIVVAFGSILNIQKDRMDVLLAAMNKTTAKKFIVKLNKEETPKDLGPHILTSPWLPQNDLLAHKNTIAFISHCGANSVYQAIYHGVPVLAIPVITDGHGNAKAIARKGYGTMLDFCTFTEQDVQKSIEDISTGPYRKTIKKASEIFQSQQPPNERAAYWVDHVLKYGSDHLRYYGLDLPFYKKYSIDVMTFIFVILVSFSGLVSFCLRLIFRLLLRCCKKNKEKSD